METNKLQKRELFIPNCIQMREAQDDGKGNIIDANAIVTGVETVLYEDEYERQIEVIDRSCIRQEFLDKQNALINIFHEYITSFARSSKFGGTADISEREGQVNFRVSSEESIVSRHARDLIANGTINGCSFEFWPKNYEIERRQGADGKKEIVIRHTEFAAIDALTLAARPAYPTTSVNLRELYGIVDDADPDAEEKRDDDKPECNCEECALKNECQGKDKKECPADKEEQCKAKENAEREKKTRESSLAAIQRDVELTELEQEYINQNF